MMAANRPCDRQRENETGAMMTRLATLKKKWMRDPEFRKAYRQADGEYAVVEALIRARTKAKMSQTDLARKLGTTQSAVARLEGGRVSPTVATLRRYAEATGSKLEINLVAM
jgi:ribosome-binding protein aMBF1 (putative translation factor)